MTITASAFRSFFGETFARTPESMIAARLAIAEARTPAEVWTVETIRDAGVYYLAAHMLALESPARAMRKGEPPGESPYSRERKILEAIVSSGFRTAGAAPYAGDVALDAETGGR
jgi:hypothetical protein